MCKKTKEVDHELHGDLSVFHHSRPHTHNKKFHDISNKVININKAVKEMKKWHYVWRMLDYFSFDIRTAGHK